MTCVTVIRGVEYPSQRAAARALSVPHSTVYRAYHNGTLEHCGLGLNGGRPLTIRGVQYVSQTQAARALGVSAASVSKCAERGTLERCGLHLKDGNSKVTTYKGMTFKSQRAAAKYFGVGVNVVARDQD